MDEDFGPTEEQSFTFKLPSEEEWLVEGRRLKKSTSVIPIYEPVEDWFEKLEVSFTKWQDKTGNYGSMPKEVSIANEFLGLFPNMIGEHSKEKIKQDIKGYLDPKANEGTIDRAASIIYRLTRPSTMDLKVVEMLGPGDIECPEREE